MLVDRADILLEQFADECLRQPDRFVFEAALDARPAVLRLVEDDAGLRRLVDGHGRLL